MTKRLFYIIQMYRLVKLTFAYIIFVFEYIKISFVEEQFDNLHKRHFQVNKKIATLLN